jgi:hypothetical protein
MGATNPKGKMKNITSAVSLGIVLASLGQSFGQTNLQFTAIAQTDEGAIRLAWASQSNHVYQVQCADTLLDTNNGAIAWQVLWDNYPSQGSNTFWLDTGNYLLAPPILHPSKSPARFYRILDKGPDDLVGDEPAVSITSPTSGFVASGLLTVSVSASAESGSSVDHMLYVDGQEMWPSPDGTNYVINTCEWGNGPHVLFATVRSSTAIDGPANSYGLAGNSVSPFVSVVFSNLITRISFSEPLFRPALGQTQQVSAVFAANSDWTLAIEDIYSNTVRTASGSGPFMQFNWDGTGDGGTNIPNGLYYYYISAQTNGQSMASAFEMNSGVSGASSLAGSPGELWAMPADGSGPAMPLAIYPPGWDTNSLMIFEATWSEMTTSRISTSSDAAFSSGGMDSPTPDDYSGASSQAAPAAPTRPAATPTKGSAGSFGVAYQTYNANGSNGVNADPIENNSQGVHTYVQIDGNSGTTHINYARFNTVDKLAINFTIGMEGGGWDMGYFDHDKGVTLSGLKGSGNPFNSVDVGMLIVHGAYGTSTDMQLGRMFKQMYFPIASGGGAQYLRMSDMSLGGPSTNSGLKWMALLACTSLYPQNWNSMQSQGIKPYNSNMHMILGTATDFGADPNIGTYWADYMIKGTNGTPMRIQDAWYAAAKQAYIAGTTNLVAYISPTKFAIAADNNCLNDYLQTKTNTVLAGTWSMPTPVQVYPP